MKIQIIISGLVISSLPLFGQGNSDNRNPPPPNPYDVNSECRKNHRLTFKDRLKNYPFNCATTILVVSFNNLADSVSDTNIINEEGKIPIIAGKLNYSDLSEKITLVEQQIDSLTDILYNYDYNGITNSIITRNCFDPHNAIVFLNAQGNMFEYIEICFLCDQINKSSENIEIGNFCFDKYDLLKNYFRRIGLTIGVESK